MSMFSFLSTLKLDEKVAAVKASLTPASKNPTTADIRVFRNGSVYPSATLVTSHNLEYTPKDSTAPANAFDVIDSRLVPGYPQAVPNVVFIALVPKTSPKTDLFGFTKYTPEGLPAADVLTQGTASFGKQLIVMLSEVYEVTEEQIFGGNNFVDLVITPDALPVPSFGFYWFPKTIERGEKKGQLELVRRENTTAFALVFKGISAEYPREDGSFITADESTGMPAASATQDTATPEVAPADLISQVTPDTAPAVGAPVHSSVPSIL